MPRAGRSRSCRRPAEPGHRRSGAGRAAPEAGTTTARRPKAARASGTIYQLKIALQDIRPPGRRRVLVPGCSPAALHEVIQAAMRWENDHLHDFEIGGERDTDPRGRADLDMGDASRVGLGRVTPEGEAKLRYPCDFGDNWRHEVLVEKIKGFVEWRGESDPEASSLVEVNENLRRHPAIASPVPGRWAAGWEAWDAAPAR